MKSMFAYSLLLLGLAFLCTDFAAAQPPGRGGPGGPARGAFGGPAGSWIALLRMDSIQDEIELVPDQVQEIELLQQEMWERMQERMAELRGLEPEERRQQFADLRSEMEEQQGVYQKKIEQVLLPMQLKRLKELQLQSQARRNGEGAMGLLQNEELMEELGIDADQKKKLNEKAEAVRKDLEEKIKKLRSEAEEDILSVLTSEQRKSFRDKVGEWFDFAATERRMNFENRGEGRRGGRERRPESDDN